MIYQELEDKLKNSPSLKLLRTKRSAFILSFLKQEFKDNNEISVGADRLLDELAAFIDKYLNPEEEEDILIKNSPDSLSKAKRFLDLWSEESWLRNYVDDNTKRIYYVLTKHTEKVFQILEVLKDKDFVGAESKFQDIFLKLEDIVNNSIADPESRISELERQKKEIEQEIERINKQGIVKHYEDYQIKTRIDDVYRLTNELVGDFKEVEDNFRDITKSIYEKQAEHSYTKGNLLGYAFDSVDKLKESDQGKSFFSFWHFLLNDNEQNNLRNLVEKSISTLEKRNIIVNDKFLRRIKTLLHSAGQKVLESNDRLGEKLTKVISERNSADNKKSRDTIRDIRLLALKLSEYQLPEDCGITLELDAEIFLPIERPLAKQSSVNQYDDIQPISAVTPQDIDRLTLLYNPRLIDRKVLANNVRELLKDNEKVSLAEVLEKYPLNKGLSELVAYITLSDVTQKMEINYSKSELLNFDLENKKYLEAPQIIYLK